MRKLLKHWDVAIIIFIFILLVTGIYYALLSDVMLSAGDRELIKAAKQHYHMKYEAELKFVQETYFIPGKITEGVEYWDKKRKELKDDLKHQLNVIRRGHPAN